MQLVPFTTALLRDRRGTMAIETAFVAPLLLIMAFGGFEVSYMVARQSELRTAAAESVALVLSAEAGSALDVATIEDILETSTGLDDDQVTITEKFRCDDEADFVDTRAECDPAAVISGFLVLEMNETYSPKWTEFGIGDDVEFTVERTVQVS